MREQDRNNDRRPSRPEGDVREPRIRRPDLDSEENLTAEREAFFQDFDLASRQHTGEPYYPESSGYSDPGYAPQDQDYETYSPPSPQGDFGQDDYDSPAYGMRSHDSDSYGAEHRAQDMYRAEEYGEEGTHQDFSESQDSYEPQEQVYYSVEEDEAAPWERVKKEDEGPREPNPILEKAQQITIDALKGVVLWVKLFFSHDPRRAMNHALKGKETFSFVPVLLVLILIVPIQTLLGFQASAAGLSAQISAFQGLSPVITPGKVYGSDLLRYLLEFVVLTGLYFGLLKLLKTERKIEGAVNAVAVSYFPLIFITPLAIVMNYVSFTMTSALMTAALLLQFVLLGYGLQTTLELEASEEEGEKQRSWFWFYIGFVVVAIIVRAFVISLVMPSLNMF